MAGLCLRWGLVRRAAALLCVFGLGAGMLLASFLLVMPSTTRQQQVVMGNHAALVQDSSSTPLGARLDLAACTQAVQRVAPGICVAQMEAFGHGVILQPGSQEVADLMAFEADWPSRPMGEVFTLASGRWPTAPGEVALTSGMPAATSLTAWGGRVRLRVVGTIDVAGLGDQVALLGQGTFSGQPSRGLSMSGIFAGLQIFTDGDPLAAATAGYRAVGRPAPPAEAVTANLIRASQVSVSPLSQKGAWYRLLPSLLLAGLGGLLVLVRAAGPATRLRSMARRTGVDDAQLAWAMSCALVLLGLAASAVGTCVGAALVAGPGRLVMHWLRPHLYLAPITADPHLALIACAASLPMVTLPAVTRLGRLTRPRPRTPGPGPLAALGAALLVGGLPLSQIGDGPGKHTWLWTGSCMASSGVACLATLLLVAWNHCPRKPIAGEMSRRIRRGLLPTQLPLVAALASLLAVVACITSSLGTTIATLDDELSSSASAPQHAAYFRADTPAVRALIPAVARASGTTPHGLTFADGSGILVATDVQGVVAAIGRPVTTPEMATLDAGGVLLASSVQPKAPVDVVAGSGRRQIPGRALTTYDLFLAARPGIMTAAGYRRAGLGDPGPAMFYLLTGPDAPQRVAHAATSMGIGRAWYNIASEPQHYLRRAWERLHPLAAALLSGGVMITLVGSVASRLRSYRARLRALGLPEAWGLRTVLVHATCLTIVVLASVAAAGAISFLLVCWQTPPTARGLRHFPWADVLRLELGIVAGSLLGTLLAARRLFSNERLS